MGFGWCGFEKADGLDILVLFDELSGDHEILSRGRLTAEIGFLN
jgi:hypothetical protein